MKVFLNARDLISEHSVVNFHLRILQSRVGRLIVGDGTECVEHHNVILHNCDRNLINKTQPLYMPQQYPLLFPYGKDGWRIGILFTNSSSTCRDSISMCLDCNIKKLKEKCFYKKDVCSNNFMVNCYAAIK